MKKGLLVLFIGWISAIAQGQNIVYDTIRYAKEHYAKRVILFKSQPLLKGRDIFLGNSITEFGDWRKLLNDSTVINRGIAADNTFGVLDRLEDVITRQPGKLFLEIGINDISQNIPVAIIVKNILTIAGRVTAKSPETKIYVLSILPTNDQVKNEYPDAFNKNEQVNLVNRQLKRKAKENKFTYIDLNKKLRDKDGKLDVKYAKPDGIHLNQMGYQVWIRLLKTKKYL
ncbi:MAG: GDSL-type esterase/lipase family protein [Bacteroidota bacterium]|nr:GDSL-type esterase/lipase family protein [Bacteroidota bacterium]